MMRYVFDRVENIVRKGMVVPHIFLLQQCFQKAFSLGVIDLGLCVTLSQMSCGF